MLYWILLPLAGHIHAFNLIRYISFRAGGACLTALVISFWLGPRLIRQLRAMQRHGQPIRTDGPERHLIEKKGTPTMGGTLILLALGASTLLWADLSNGYVWATLMVTFGYGAIGFADDFLKLTKRNTKGVSGRVRLLGEAAIGLIAALWMTHLMPHAIADGVAVPFLKNFLIPLGFMFPIFGLLVMMGSANAVNFTDGLDGLATVPTMIAAAVFGLIAYLVGNRIFAGYLEIHFIPGVGELTVFLSALIGAGMGFLWFKVGS